MADAIFVELDGYLGPPRRAKGLKAPPGGPKRKKHRHVGIRRGAQSPARRRSAFSGVRRAASNQHVEMGDPIRWAGWFCMHVGQRGVED